jgi:hypothetical protein
MDHMKSAMADSMGGAHHEEKPKKEIKHIEVKKGKSGGHIITHHHTHPMHEAESHVTGTDDQLADHVMEHMGTPAPESTPETEAAANAPAGAAPAAAPMAAGAGAPAQGAM